MKKYMFLLVFMLASVSVFGQGTQLEKLFDKYENTPGVTSIKITKPMFGLIRNMKLQDEDFNKIQPLLNDVNSLLILVMEESEMDDADTVSGVGTFKEIHDAISSALSDLNYEEVMAVNNEDSKIKFLAKNADSDMLDNLIVSINQDDENVFILLDGRVSMTAVAGIINDKK